MNVITFIAFRDEMQKIAWTAAQAHEMAADTAHLAARVMKANKGNLSHLPSNTRKEVYHAFEHGARTGAGMKAAPVKLAAFIGPASDIAGLGVLAVPGIKTLRDPKASATEKNHAKWETAGLGTLAGGVALHERHELAEGAKHFLHSKGFGNKLRAAKQLVMTGAHEALPAAAKLASVKKTAGDFGLIGRAARVAGQAATKAPVAQAVKPSGNAMLEAIRKMKAGGGGTLSASTFRQ